MLLALSGWQLREGNVDRYALSGSQSAFLIKIIISLHLRFIFGTALLDSLQEGLG